MEHGGIQATQYQSLVGFCVFMGFVMIKRNRNSSFKLFGEISENQVVMGWLSLMIMSLETWRCSRASSRGRCRPPVHPPPRSCIPNAVLRSAPQCEYQRDGALLVNEPTAGRGGECVCVCVCPVTPTHLTPKHNVCVGIDCMNPHFRLWFLVLSLRLCYISLW